MNKKNKVVVFFSNAYAGIATYQAQNIQFLLKKNIDVVLFDDKPELTIRNINKLLLNKIKIIRTNKLSNIINNNTLYTQELEKIINKYDNVFISLSNPIFLVVYFLFFGKIKKINKIKIILTIHSGILTWSLKNMILTILYSLIYFIPHKIIFVSKYTQSWWLNFWYLKNLISKNKIIRHGTQTLTPKKNKIKNKKIFNVGFVGRIEEEKSPSLFISIAERSYLKNKDFRFYMFGEGKLKSQMIKKSLGLVNFQGFKDKSEIYNFIDILLITSPIETLSYVALEAKMFGVPTVTCSKGGITEIINNNYDGLITQNKNPDILLTLLEKCKRSYKKLSKNALKASKLHDEKISLNKFWNFISS